MNLEPYISKVTELHAEFTAQEVQELCEEFLSRYKDKTKEETKHKALQKFLTQEFNVQFDEQVQDDQPSVYKPFVSIPKQYFQSKLEKKSEYILSISGLYKQLGTTELFADTHMRIRTGDKIALVGKNGAGKSTLLKMIIGTEERNTGEIDIAKETTIGFLSQDMFRDSRDRIVADEMLTTLPQVTQTMNRLRQIDSLIEAGHEDAVALIEEQQELIERMIHNDGYQKYALQVEILRYFGFSDQQLQYQIKQLSGGEQTKVQIAKFLIQEVDLLILDEPTNHLDIEGIMFLEHFCTQRQKTLICISHDKKFLNTAFSKVVEIRNKKLFFYEGNYDAYIQQKQDAFEKQSKEYTTQQKYLEQQERFIERFRYKSSKAAQVQSRIKMLDKLEKVEAPEQETSSHHVSFQIQERLPNRIMEFSNIHIGYDTKTLIQGPKYIEVTKDMKIGIIGKNGVGKTTLIKTILGELAPVEGTISIHEKMKIGSYAQAFADLPMEQTVVEAVVGPGISNKDARAFLGSLHVSNEKMDQRIGTLSGGEKAKVALTKMLLSKPHIIIMDEPTNHLDIPSKDAIQYMLSQFNGVTLIVSHDRDFLMETSNLLRVVHKGQLEVFHSLDRGFARIES